MLESIFGGFPKWGHPDKSSVINELFWGSQPPSRSCRPQACRPCISSLCEPQLRWPCTWQWLKIGNPKQTEKQTSKLIFEAKNQGFGRSQDFKCFVFCRFPVSDRCSSHGEQIPANALDHSAHQVHIPKLVRCLDGYSCHISCCISSISCLNGILWDTVGSGMSFYPKNSFRILFPVVDWRRIAILPWPFFLISPGFWSGRKLAFKSPGPHFLGPAAASRTCDFHDHGRWVEIQVSKDHFSVEKKVFCFVKLSFPEAKQKLANSFQLRKTLTRIRMYGGCRWISILVFRNGINKL